MTATLSPSDLGELKTKQQATWASGNYAVIGTAGGGATAGRAKHRKASVTARIGRTTSTSPPCCAVPCCRSAFQDQPPLRS